MLLLGKIRDAAQHPRRHPSGFRCCVAAGCLPNLVSTSTALVANVFVAVLTGPVPRHQAALTTAMRALLPGLTRPPMAYDPVFTSIDIAALELLQFEVCTHMDEALHFFACWVARSLVVGLAAEVVKVWHQCIG